MVENLTITEMILRVALITATVIDAIINIIRNIKNNRPN
jgi:hypothetical protein